jgi:type I restriction enzyme, S subunit
MMLTFPRYNSYKDSGIHWIGEMPAHWNVAPGLNCYEKRKELNKDMVEDSVLSISYGRIVIRPPEKLTGLVPESFETYQLVDPGDIIIRPTDLQNDWNTLRTAIARDRGIITSAYLRLKAKGNISPDYLRLVLHTYDLLKVYYGMGSGLRQNLDYSRDFKRLPIILPPRAEQNRIVAFLDEKTAAIDDAIAKKRRLIELLQEQKGILINTAVTQGLDPNAPMKESGVEWIGRIPAHWEIRRLKHITKTIIDSEHKTAPTFEEGKYLVVRTTNVKNGKLTLNGAQFTNLETYQKWTKRGIPCSGDILLTREAPAGEAFVLEQDHYALLGQRMVLIQPNTNLLNAHFFVFSIYGGVAKKYIDQLSVGSTVAHFNMSDIKNIPVVLPSISEQTLISDHLQGLVAKFEAATEIELSGIDALNEFRIILVAEAVTGKIKV